MVGVVKKRKEKKRVEVYKFKSEARGMENKNTFRSRNGENPSSFFYFGV